VDKLPHLEAAGRGLYSARFCLDVNFTPYTVVSVQTLTQGINSLVAGLTRVQEEVTHLKQLRAPLEGDRFVEVMQVKKKFRTAFRGPVKLIRFCSPSCAKITLAWTP
jgi:hypothetical protein